MFGSVGGEATVHPRAPRSAAHVYPQGEGGSSGGLGDFFTASMDAWEAAMGRKAGIPNMKATLAKYTDAEPSEAHYKAAARGLRIKRDEIPEFPHVRALAIWVDTVLWCNGDQNARNALLDRMLAKESRIVVDGELTSRRAVSDASSVSSDEARDYMERLEGDPETPENETVH